MNCESKYIAVFSIYVIFHSKFETDTSHEVKHS